MNGSTIVSNSMNLFQPLRIGGALLPAPLGIAPMAGMTDSAFRRLVKRLGGCGLVVTEMVSSEGLVRGIDRTLEFAEYTAEERPVSIQIFGGDPAKMSVAAQIVEQMGADIVDVNMGCPVPKIAKHHAGCSLMREPTHAAEVIAAMTKAVKIPVTVKMRSGWNDAERNCETVAEMVQDAGASAVTIHGRTAAQSYTGAADWDIVARVASRLTIPVFGSGDVVTPEQIVEKLQSGVAGVLVGRGVLRNPWILAQAADLLSGRPARVASRAERGQFLLDYIALLEHERVRENERAVPKLARNPELGTENAPSIPNSELRTSHDRWVINKIRALGGYYTKGLDGGPELRHALNSTPSVAALRDLITTSFNRDEGPNCEIGTQRSAS
ncbi:MAG: tRNA dihydrouridine synthase DusB [Vicinamibacterales bacterium]